MEPSNDQFSQSFCDGGRIRSLQLLFSVPVRRASDALLLRLIGRHLQRLGFHRVPRCHVSLVQARQHGNPQTRRILVRSWSRIGVFYAAVPFLCVCAPLIPHTQSLKSELESLLYRKPCPRKSTSVMSSCPSAVRMNCIPRPTGQIISSMV
jgi:hypothetical protein